MQKQLETFLETQKIPHALLFVGPKASDKKQIAYQFASNLLNSKKKLEQHPDAHFFFPEGKLEMHPVTSVRKLIEQASLAPLEALWKIFILHEAEKMLPTSSHALLKILEEPPTQTVIILLTEHPNRLLPTILSRCQMIQFSADQGKKTESQLLSILAKQASLADFESDQPEEVFETVLLWYRDRWFLELTGEGAQLHFPNYLPQLRKTALIPLEKVEQGVRLARLAFERSTKLSLCLEMLFLYLSHA